MQTYVVILTKVLPFFCKSQEDAEDFVEQLENEMDDDVSISMYQIPHPEKDDGLDFNRLIH